MRQVVQRMLQAVMLAALVLGSAACHSPSSHTDGAGHGKGELVIAADVGERLAQFVPTPIEVDTSGLSSAQRRVLNHLLRASEYMDAIFLRQAWTGNPGLLERLEHSRDPRARAALDYFRMSYGPWDRLDETPFIGEQERPETAGYYPDHLGREEMEAWLEQHPEDKEALQSLYTVVRRHGKDLVAIPYTVEYRKWLKPAAEELQKAAEITENQSLAEYLRRIAEAFLRDDVDLETLSSLYYEADLAWMDLDSRVEITIGPYEVY